jgi:hypothetical protein
MEKTSTMEAAPLFSGEAWFDPMEAELRERIRGFLEEMVEQEATAALAGCGKTSPQIGCDLILSVPMI